MYEQDDRDLPVCEQEPDYVCDWCADTGWALELGLDGTARTAPCRKCLTQPEQAQMEASLR